MEIKTVLLILIFIVSVSFAPSIWKNRNTKDDTLKKKNRLTANIVIFTILGLYGLYYYYEARQIRHNTPPTLASIVEEAKKQYSLPYDFGNGIVLVNFHADGNKLVYTLSLNMSSEDFEDIAFAKSQQEEAMKKETNQAMCYGPNAQFLYDKNVHFVYIYTLLDKKTIEIEFSARDCPLVK